MDASARAAPTPPAGGRHLEWTDSLGDVAVGRVASVALTLLSQPERWIHRRVERLYFRDYESAHHQISVDFTLPLTAQPVAAIGDEAVYAAPLFLLAKGPPDSAEYNGKPIPTAPYSNIDFLDEHGTRLPLLTQKDACRIAAAILTERARELIGDQIDEDELLSQQISDLAILDTPQRRTGLSGLFPATLPDGDVRGVLKEDQLFRELAYAFSEHSVVVCLFEGYPGRRIVKLAYEEQTNTGNANVKERLLRSLGVKSEQLFVNLTEIGASSTYHVEIDVPKDLELNEVGLVGTRYQHFAEGVLTKLKRSQQDYFIRQVGHAPSGHIYLPESVGPRVGGAWIKLRARRPGFLIGAWIASVITSVSLGLATLAAPDVVRTLRPEAAIAILLLVPTLLAGYVARPGEHAITARMLRVARLLLVVDGAIPFLAALALLTSSEYEMLSTASQRTANGSPSPTVVVSLGQRRLCHRRSWHGSPSRVAWACHPVGAISYHVTGRKRNRHVVAASKHGTFFSLQKKWLGLALISVLFVVFFTLANWLPLPHGKSIYEVQRPQDQSW